MLPERITSSESGSSARIPTRVAVYSRIVCRYPFVTSRVCVIHNELVRAAKSHMYVRGVPGEDRSMRRVRDRDLTVCVLVRTGTPS